ncbi:hypothetical protein GCM10010193_12130 [Kitasatospora atroaurantiaca]|uniref:Cyclase n=1 Tax=Kitasatospora atroaurantiaca TaxID=285545 RepID=A0A561EQN2_9ACTN|nr:hypothetical protein [Kitasatospora atroaurantiaca]TWE17905.1 hypothetical protein FB465_2947 [Kitasatospora atroaurantiaca]
MTTLRIEHPTPDYDAWKQVFDADPLGREQSGVRGYRILRSVGDPTLVMIDLDFDSAGEAESFLTRLRVLWQSNPLLTGNPKARVVETAESKDY